MDSGNPDGGKPRQNATKTGRCPICGAPSEAEFRPFCSSRCSDVDLSRWLRGAYAIPGRADVDEDGDEAIAASGANDPGRMADSGEDGTGRL